MRPRLLAYGCCPRTQPSLRSTTTIVAEAIKLVLDGKAIVILARQLEPAANVRDGMLDALNLLSPPEGVAGHG